MIAAVYARKSTDQAGVVEEQRSVARQVEHAYAYAQRKGWSTGDEWTYVDDGISGAEFATRPGFLRLMNALKPRPPFQALIMSEESRLGREAIETAYALKQIVQAGVRVFFYLEDRERTLDSPTDKIMLSLTAFADELEREKARQRTYDAMSRKAAAGHVTGGRVFGYDNVPVLGRDGQRSHVERRINEPEAVVVRRIFELAAGGVGKKGIARALNDAGAACPEPQRDRPRAWAPSSVFEVLNRPLYRGEIVWNQTRKRDAWGRQRQAPRPESEWLRLPAPDLRIVSDDLWRAAEARLGASRALYLRRNRGAVWGRPAGHWESKYLLTGLATCTECGGSMIVKSRPHGRRIGHRYGCSSYYQRGTAVCRNGRDVAMLDADEAVLAGVTRDLLTPEVADRAVAVVLEALRHDDGAEQAAALRAEIASADARAGNLTAAIAAGGDLAPLVHALQEQERAKREAERQLERLTGAATVDVDADGLRRRLRARLRDWRELLRQEVAIARGLLRQLLDGKIAFKPTLLEDGTPGYEISGRLAWNALFFGVIGCSIWVASPTANDRDWNSVTGDTREHAA